MNGRAKAQEQYFEAVSRAIKDLQQNWPKSGKDADRKNELEEEFDKVQKVYPLEKLKFQTAPYLIFREGKADIE